MDKEYIRKYEKIVDENIKTRGYMQHDISFFECKAIDEVLKLNDGEQIYEKVLRGREWVETGTVIIDYGRGLKAFLKRTMSKMMNFRIWALQNYYDEYLVNNQKIIEQLYQMLQEQKSRNNELDDRIKILETQIKKEEV